MGKKSKDSGEAVLTLQNFYIPQKVDAFCNSYLPCEDERNAREVYTDAKLRIYFQASIIPMLGDLLTLYINELDARGFHFHTSVTGEPAIFVRERVVSVNLLPGLLACGENGEEDDTLLTSD